MSTTANGTAVDLDTGFGVLFGLLAIAAAGVSAFADGLLGALGFGAAVVFGALLVASTHWYA